MPLMIIYAGVIFLTCVSFFLMLVEAREGDWIEAMKFFAAGSVFFLLLLKKIDGQDIDFIAHVKSALSKDEQRRVANNRLGAQYNLIAIIAWIGLIIAIIGRLY
jgi:NADH:ubiquinone oxidoreductase subunit 6 (subunit J)